MRRCLGILRRLNAGQGSRGLSLLEAVVAIGLFTIVGSAVLAGFSMTQRSGTKTEGASVAENLGRSEMEYVSSSTYQDPPAAYATVTPPSGYGVSVQNQVYVPGNSNIAMIVVTVTRGSDVLLTIQTLRTRE